MLSGSPVLALAASKEATALESEMDLSGRSAWVERKLSSLSCQTSSRRTAHSCITKHHFPAVPRVTVFVPRALQFAIPGVLRISAASPTEAMVPREQSAALKAPTGPFALCVGQQTLHVPGALTMHIFVGSKKDSRL